MFAVGTERTLRQVVGDSQLAAGKLPDQQLAVSAVPSARETAATLQLPVRTEKSAQTQLEPMLGSMAVAETEHSAPTLSVLVRIVLSEPVCTAESTALAAVGVAIQLRESTARHL